MNIDNVIKETQDLLFENSDEWKDRYSIYANEFLTNKKVIELYRKQFNEFPPLHFYISTNLARRAKNTLSLDVRYRGQSVATLKANQNGITISTTKQYDKNSRDFDCKIKLDNTLWSNAQATEFRKFFKERPYTRNDNDKNKRNEEHNVENLLLKEFSKRSSSSKQILGIQPIKIGGIRFGMPTPISASNHKALKYSGSSGGGIDIFTRTGKGGSRYLTVIEVKDENNSKEPPKDALKQAIQYAIFIRELLRSNSGKNWYKLFGFTGEIPKTLTIRAVCAMPDDIIDTSFAKKSYAIGNDLIECHYIYFKYDGKQVFDFQTSL
jgi:hypothetical protein